MASTESLSKDASIETESQYGQEGFTWRSAMAIVYSAVVFMPAVLFMNLSTGSGVLSTYVVLILFVELARYFGKPLSIQEAVIMFMCSGIASGDTIALSLVYSTYLRSAPITALFREPATGIPFPLAIPTWSTPPLTSAIYELRTFMHPDWMIPLAIGLASIVLLRIVDVSLGLFAYKFYVETLRLPFPLQQVDASLVETVIGRPANRMKVLVISAVVGVGWGLLAYAAPLASAGAVQLLPLPFASLNRFMERILPGSSFGVSVDLMATCVGLLLPFWTSVSIFMGSFAFYTVGNGILVSMYPEKPAGIFGWTPGMDIMQCYQWSNLYIWSSVTIGLGLAAGLVPLIRNSKVLLRTFSRAGAGKSEAKVVSPVPIWVSLAIWAVASGVSVGLTAVLVPDFPIWISALVSFGWTLVSVLIVGRMLGETSLSPAGGVGGGSLFFVREAAIISSGYQRIDIWYAPLVVSAGGASMLAPLKVCELTGTKVMSYVKGLFFAYPIAWFMSFLLVQLFWSIAPIPSAAYPMAMATWPFGVTMSNIMVSGFRNFFRPEAMGAALVVGVGIQLAIDFLHLPFSLIGFLLGAVTMVPVGLAYLVGGLAGRLIAWRIGKDRWDQYKVVVVAGIILGGSIVASTAAAIGLIGKAKWVLPY